MALRQPTKEELAKVKSQPVNPNLPKTPGIQMVANPRDKVTTPAQNASISVPKTVQTPSIVTPTQNSQLRSLTQQEAQTIQGNRDRNYSQNTVNPGMISNPRDQQTVSGGGVQQGTTIGGPSLAGAEPEFGTNLPAATSTLGQPTTLPTGQSAMTPETGVQSPSGVPTPGQAPTGAEGATGAPTGAQEGVSGTGAPMTQQEQLYAGMQEGAQGFLEVGQEGIIGLRDAKDNARALQLQQTLGSTNAVDMLKAIGKDLNDLSLQELEQLAVSQGLDLRDEDKQRIKQEGASAIESMGYERGDRLAEVDYQKAQLERTIGRAMTEQEKFNAQQDAKMRRLANAFGFGEDLGANVQTMRVAQEGQQALNDLASDFAGRGGLLANQADAIQRAYYSGVREVESQTNGLIEAKFAQIQNTVSDLIKQGVTDEEDLRKATFDLNKEYIGLYNDANKALAEYLTDAQKTAFDQMYKAMEFQQTEDKNLTDQTGFIHQNGQMLTDEQGNPISNAEMLRFMTTEQRQLYALEQDQKQFESRLGFDMTKEQFSQMMDQARYVQDAEQFNANYGLNLSKFEFDQLKDAADREMTMADKGLQYAAGPVDVSTKTSSFNPAGSKYGVQPTGNGVTINAPVKGGKLVSSRRQCGMYVNDAIGIPGFFGDTIEQKRTKVTSSTPTPGSAFVLDVPGLKWGHVGMVEQVNPDGTVVISESNYDGNENFRRITTTMDALKARGLVGFTGGLQQGKTLTKTGVSATGAPMPGMTIAGKPQTAEQAQTQGYADMMTSALKDMAAVSESIENSATGARGIVGGLFGGLTTGRALPEAHQGPEVQQQIQAENNFINAILRRESGAAVSDAEYDRYATQYFPKAGDTPEVIAQKKRNREEKVKSMYTQAGVAPTASIPSSPTGRLSDIQNKAVNTVMTQGAESIGLTPDQLLQNIQGAGQSLGNLFSNPFGNT